MEIERKCISTYYIYLKGKEDTDHIRIDVFLDKSDHINYPRGVEQPKVEYNNLGIMVNKENGHVLYPWSSVSQVWMERVAPREL